MMRRLLLGRRGEGGWWILDIGYWMLNSGYWSLRVGSAEQDAGCRIFGFRNSIFEFNHSFQKLIKFYT